MLVVQYLFSFPIFLTYKQDIVKNPYQLTATAYIIPSNIWKSFQKMTGEKDCLVPKITDTFILGELIGTGSFSNVYKAVIRGAKDSIAIKAFKLHMNKDGKFLERAASEMAFLQILDHNNIIQFILCDMNREFMYLGIEYSPFGSLTKIMPNGKMYPEDIVQGLMKQIMAALNYLHTKFISHGDVKPDNIIIIKEDPYLIKISDFGLAEVQVDPIPCIKRMGSFYYMAPEIHLGFPADLTADLYSAGIVMYELLFGRRPFSTSTKEAFATLMRKKPTVNYLSTVYTGLSQECKDFMRDLLSYEKQKRPHGETLRQNPFIGLDEDSRPSLDYYKKGCDMLTEGINLMENKQFGPAFISVTHAILLLQIYARSVYNDTGLYIYLSDRLKEYKLFNKEIEKRLLSKDDRAPLHMPLNNEHLRCMLSSTPVLVNAFDMCLVGEMYIRQHNIQTGGDMLRSGLDSLFFNIRSEPDADRKVLLFSKMKQWVNLLETLQRNEASPKPTGQKS